MTDDKHKLESEAPDIDLPKEIGGDIPLKGSKVDRTERVERKLAQPERPEIDLRDSNIAALLAWLVPGAGHYYQRRYGKGALFTICILGTFIYGLTMGGNRVVYASWKENDRRWQYVCQLGVGAAAFPAIIQSMKTKRGEEPFFQIAKRYPARYPGREFEIMTEKEIAAYYNDKNNVQSLLVDGFMAPPAGEVDPNNIDVLGMWHKEFDKKFEMGTLFTIVAGLLNILAIYDAYAGPAYDEPDEKKKKKRKGKTRIKNKTRENGSTDSLHAYQLMNFQQTEN